MKTVKFQLEPLTCPSCIKKIEGKLDKMDGVENAKVMFNSSKVTSTYDENKITSEELQETIEKLGYPIAN